MEKIKDWLGLSTKRVTEIPHQRVENLQDSYESAEKHIFNVSHKCSLPSSKFVSFKRFSNLLAVLTEGGQIRIFENSLEGLLDEHGGQIEVTGEMIDFFPVNGAVIVVMKRFIFLYVLRAKEEFTKQRNKEQSSKTNDFDVDCQQLEILITDIKRFGEIIVAEADHKSLRIFLIFSKGYMALLDLDEISREEQPIESNVNYISRNVLIQSDFVESELDEIFSQHFLHSFNFEQKIILLCFGGSEILKSSFSEKHIEKIDLNAKNDVSCLKWVRNDTFVTGHRNGNVFLWDSKRGKLHEKQFFRFSNSSRKASTAVKRIDNISGQIKNQSVDFFSLVRGNSVDSSSLMIILNLKTNEKSNFQIEFASLFDLTTFKIISNSFDVTVCPDALIQCGNELQRKTKNIEKIIKDGIVPLLAKNLEIFILDETNFARLWNGNSAENLRITSFGSNFSSASMLKLYPVKKEGDKQLTFLQQQDHDCNGSHIIVASSYQNEPRLDFCCYSNLTHKIACRNPFTLRPEYQKRKITVIRFCKFSGFLICGFNDGTVTVFKVNLKTNKLKIQSEQIVHVCEVSAVHFNRETKLAASLDVKGSYCLFDFQTGETKIFGNCHIRDSKKIASLVFVMPKISYGEREALSVRVCGIEKKNNVQFYVVEMKNQSGHELYRFKQYEDFIKLRGEIAKSVDPKVLCESLWSPTVVEGCQERANQITELIQDLVSLETTKAFLFGFLNIEPPKKDFVVNRLKASADNLSHKKLVDKTKDAITGDLNPVNRLIVSCKNGTMLLHLEKMKTTSINQIEIDLNLGEIVFMDLVNSGQDNKAPLYFVFCSKTSVVVAEYRDDNSFSVKCEKRLKNEIEKAQVIRRDDGSNFICVVDSESNLFLFSLLCLNLIVVQHLGLIAKCKPEITEDGFLLVVIEDDVKKMEEFHIFDLFGPKNDEENDRKIERYEGGNDKKTIILTKFDFEGKKAKEEKTKLTEEKTNLSARLSKMLMNEEENSQKLTEVEQKSAKMVQQSSNFANLAAQVGRKFK